MNNSNEIDVRKAASWLSGEIEIRMPKVWLAIGALAVIVLLIVALD